MKKLLLFLMLGALPAHASLPDPHGPVCLLYATSAFSKVSHNRAVHSAAVVIGTLPGEPVFVAPGDASIDLVGCRPSFQPEPPPSAARRHAICVWQKDAAVWVVDTHVNDGNPYRVAALTDLLQNGDKVTPEQVFAYLHRGSTEIFVTNSDKAARLPELP